MKNVKLQTALESELTLLLPLVRAYHEFEGISLTEKEREDGVRNLIADKSRGGIWLVYIDTELVGYLALCIGYSIEFAGMDAFLDEFYIRPDFRGLGIGAISLDLIKDEAKKLAIRAIHLEVDRTNIKAQRLYSRSGFTARDKYVLMSVNV